MGVARILAIALSITLVCADTGYDYPTPAHHVDLHPHPAPSRQSAFHQPTPQHQQTIQQRVVQSQYQQPTPVQHQSAVQYQQPNPVQRQGAIQYQQPSVQYHVQQPQQPAVQYQQPTTQYQQFPVQQVQQQRQPAVQYQQPPTQYQQPPNQYQQPPIQYQQFPIAQTPQVQQHHQQYQQPSQVKSTKKPLNNYPEKPAFQHQATYQQPMYFEQRLPALQQPTYNPAKSTINQQYQQLPTFGETAIQNNRVQPHLTSDSLQLPVDSQYTPIFKLDYEAEPEERLGVLSPEILALLQNLLLEEEIRINEEESRSAPTIGVPFSSYGVPINQRSVVGVALEPSEKAIVVGHITSGQLPGRPDSPTPIFGVPKSID